MILNLFTIEILMFILKYPFECNIPVIHISVTTLVNLTCEYHVNTYS